MLNWVKCHCGFKIGIVLRHKILKNGIEVDRAKILGDQKIASIYFSQMYSKFLGSFRVL